MIALLTYPPLGHSFSLSPFCAKAALLLDYSGQPWRREDTNDPRTAPYRKLPAIRTAEGRVIGDSDAIRLYLEGLGADFQPGLSDIEKAFSRALIRMAEEHLYFHVVLDRWGRDEVWPTVRQMYFHELPALLRKPISNGLRRSLMRGMDAQGLGRFSPQERLERAEQDLGAITDLLWQGPYLMGATVTLADMSVAPILNAIRQTPVETPFALRVAGDPILTEYIDRVEEAVHGPKTARLTA
ncbi:glutathione S-transferase family protein [Aestuariivita sp.]|jgi:glutathione S-transferase|uniref:glutathione S-transferase family protein n=1 Tax=Aestuariivita sp. TaxID=1872407 RepID=UPI00216F1FC8|nr:glutathione S-transferase family protein [Aestuariivita sp.]MCE8009719.1 glutathione S-transferase family protein [Aestuariivita sp.]